MRLLTTRLAVHRKIFSTRGLHAPFDRAKKELMVGSQFLLDQSTRVSGRFGLIRDRKRRTQALGRVESDRDCVRHGARYEAQHHRLRLE